MIENEWRNTEAYRSVIHAYRRERQMGGESMAVEAGISAFLKLNPHMTERQARETVRDMVDYALTHAPAWFWGPTSSGKDLVVGRVRRGES